MERKLKHEYNIHFKNGRIIKSNGTSKENAKERILTVLKANNESNEANHCLKVIKIEKILYSQHY